MLKYRRNRPPLISTLQFQWSYNLNKAAIEFSYFFYQENLPGKMTQMCFMLFIPKNFLTFHIFENRQNALIKI
jgi:hypothetical protein